MPNNKSKIEFVCLPPTISSYPLAGMTAVRSYLSKHGYRCAINYMNLILEHNSTFIHTPNSFNTLLPYLYIYNNLNNAPVANQLSIKAYIESINCHIYQSKTFYKEIEVLLNLFEQEVDKTIANGVKIVGFSSKFNQWIPAFIYAHLLKQKSSDIKCVIGGFATRSAAKSILTLHDCFDYASWGEGEIPMLVLCDMIDLDTKVSIPRLESRHTANVEYANNTHIDLDEKNIWDFSDYIEQTGSNNFIAPVEYSRGCSWNRCAFCYLSEGYKFRTKCIQQIIDELREYITKYGIYRFQFMDNNFVDADISMFEQKLDELILLRREYPKFEISFAEILPINFTSALISKMSDSGIKSVQIGFEALSQSMLNRFNKKQSLADNLFFIVNAQKYGVELGSLNIIINTPDEQVEDILECIENLHFLRFCFAKPNFGIALIELTVANYSRYLKQLKQGCAENDYNTSKLSTLLHNDKIDKIDRFSIFEYHHNIKANDMWRVFSNLQNEYMRSKYSYTRSRIEGGSQIVEVKDGVVVQSVRLDQIDTDIIKLLGSQVYSFDDLIMEFSETAEIMLEKVLFLKRCGFLYMTADKLGITTNILH